MKVLVCGSRDWYDAEAIRARLRELPRGTIVMHGGARGADEMAGHIANGLGLQVYVFRANWDAHGKSAGIKRNLKMLDQRPDLVIAFWKDASTGTGHVLHEAQKRGIPCEVYVP